MKTKKAAALTTAKTYKLQCKSYIKTAPPSSLKIQIGELLLYLQRPLGQVQRSGLQQIFETKLNEYIDLKYARIQP
jgi:hypothetical protein